MFIIRLLFLIVLISISVIVYFANKGSISSAKRAKNYTATVKAIIDAVKSGERGIYDKYGPHDHSVKMYRQDRVVFEWEGDDFIAIAGQPDKLVLTRVLIIPQQRLDFQEELRNLPPHPGIELSLWKDQSNTVGIDLITVAELNYDLSTADVTGQFIALIGSLTSFRDTIIAAFAEYNKQFVQDNSTVY